MRQDEEVGTTGVSARGHPGATQADSCREIAAETASEIEGDGTAGPAQKPYFHLLCKWLILCVRNSQLSPPTMNCFWATMPGAEPEAKQHS